MLDSRRSFLSSCAAAGALVILGQQSEPVRPRHDPLPPHPEPADKFPAATQTISDPNRLASLVAHEKELRNATDQLLIKVQEFRAKLDGTHTADVFSVNMYKQTEEIEKLAKQLRNRARP